MITKSALIIFRGMGSRRQLLFVRARGKDFFVLPGGKKESNETIEQALHRELLEELAVALESVKPLGVVEGNTPDQKPLRMHLFEASIIGVPEPRAEVVELHWCSREDVMGLWSRMTPMTKEKVLPFLTKKGLW